MTGKGVPRGAWVLVGDGAKAMILENAGDARNPNLRVLHVWEQEHPPTHEQGTDRPGRYPGGGAGVRRSAVGQTDWHRLDEDRFARAIADLLYEHAHAGRFEELIVVAPPAVLGVLRRACHKEVSDRIIEEINKDMTRHPVSDLERLLTL